MIFYSTRLRAPGRSKPVLNTPEDDPTLEVLQARIDAIDDIEAAVAIANEEHVTGPIEVIELAPEWEARFSQLLSIPIKDLTDDEMDELDDLATKKGLADPYALEDRGDEDEDDEGELLTSEDEAEYARILALNIGESTPEEDAEFERLYALKWPAEAAKDEKKDEQEKEAPVEKQTLGDLATKLLAMNAQQGVKAPEKSFTDYQEKRYQTLITKKGAYQDYDRTEFIRLFESRNGLPKLIEPGLPTIAELVKASSVTQLEIDNSVKITCSCREKNSKHIETKHDVKCVLYAYDDWKNSKAEYHPTHGIVWYVKIGKTKYLTNLFDYVASEDEAKATKCRCIIEASYHCTVCGVTRTKPEDKWRPITNGSYSGSAWSAGSSYSKCRHAMFELKFPDGTKVYASSNHSTRDKDEKHPEFAMYMDSSWRPDTLAYMLPWQDHGLPKIDFQYAIEAIIRTFDLAKSGKIVEVGCIGGHGRTGCVLACMAVLAGVKGKDAVKFVRDTYCENTVECKDQEWFPLYFEAIINGVEPPKRPEKPKPAPAKTTTTTTKTTPGLKGGSIPAKGSFGGTTQVDLSPKGEQTSGVTTSGTCPECKNPRRIRDAVAWCITSGCKKDGRKYTYTNMWLCMSCQEGASHWTRSGWKCSNKECKEYAPETRYVGQSTSKGIESGEKTVEVQTVVPRQGASVEEPEGPPYTDADEMEWLGMWGL